MRDGDPAALAGLCARRGPAVLAYCRHVAGDADAATAAAEAFAEFRAQVVAADDPASLNPEALLISATRHAAARHATVVAGGLCAEVPTLLAGRADRSISPANVEFLKGHLEVCWTCRAPVARFEAAERAYRDPPDESVPPAAAEAIVAALTAAAPVRGEEEPPPATVVALPVPTSNGTGHHDAPAKAPDEPAATGEPDLPTTEHRMLDEFAPRPRSTSADRARRERREREPRGALGGVRGVLGAAVARAQEARRTRTTDRDTTRRAAPGSRSGSGSSLPRPERPSAARGARRERSTVRPSVVLPAVLVVGALFIALLVAGVFGADDPASSPSSVAPPPAAAPPTTTTPEVVVVPGAGSASASDVERAKARARAESQRPAASDRATTTPATPPPPPPPPAAGATPPATPAAEPPATPGGGAQPKVKAKATPKPKATAKPKPKAAPAPRRKEKARIDADNGATGVEPRLPPQKSKVPDLAPPVEPAEPTPQPPG